MKRALPLLLSMLSIGLFFIIFCGLFGSVAWACLQEEKEI